jgi:hypothetical protein
MYFSTASPYLENIIVKKKENTKGILESEPKISVSGGLPLKIFSKYYGSDTDKSVDSIIKIGGLSVPIGLVLHPENKDVIRVKYSQKIDKTEENMEGGSPKKRKDFPEKVEDENDENDEYDKNDEKKENQMLRGDIEEIDDESMNNLLNMVCKLHKKQFTRKKKQI